MQYGRNFDQLFILFIKRIIKFFFVEQNIHNFMRNLKRVFYLMNKKFLNRPAGIFYLFGISITNQLRCLINIIYFRHHCISRQICGYFRSKP